MAYSAEAAAKAEDAKNQPGNYSCSARCRSADSRCAGQSGPPVLSSTRRRGGQVIHLITADVVTPSKNVLAGPMGTATVKDGFDILITDIGDAYLAEIASEKGQEVVLFKQKPGPLSCVEDGRGAAGS